MYFIGSATSEQFLKIIGCLGSLMPKVHPESRRIFAATVWNNFLKLGILSHIFAKDNNI